MIFQITLFASLVIIAAGRPQSPPEAHAPPPPAGAGQPQDSADHSPVATIIKKEFTDDGKGMFRWEYETSDGSKAEQTGHTINPGTDHEGEVIMGSYSYKSPDGQVISISYVADENGFQPKGDHIPQNPNSGSVSSNSPAAADKLAAATASPITGAPGASAGRR